MQLYCDHKCFTASHNALFNNMKFPLAIHTASLAAIILGAFFETCPFHNPSMGSNLSIHIFQPLNTTSTDYKQLLTKTGTQFQEDIMNVTLSMP